MIVSNVFGGLGNQLFQYAIGTSLARFYKTDLVLDVQDFATYDLRDFELGQLNIPFVLASKWEVFCYGNSFFHKVIRHLFKWNASRYFVEKTGYVYDASVFQQSKNLYLYGYWQSEKYFLSIRDELLKEFVIKTPSHMFHTIKDAIDFDHYEVIGLHVRRGDYVKLGLVVCDEHYYKKALDYISEKIHKKTKIVIFSDDIAWVKDVYGFLKDKDVYYVDGLSGAESLYLMSFCHHFVIANSTFSWRGAWLIQKKNKIIVAPKEWIKGGKTPDIIPENRIKL